jgi:hypothetical protein
MNHTIVDVTKERRFEHNRSLKVAVQRTDLMAHPSYKERRFASYFPFSSPYHSKTDGRI